MFGIGRVSLRRSTNYQPANKQDAKTSSTISTMSRNNLQQGSPLDSLFIDFDVVKSSALRKIPCWANLDHRGLLSNIVSVHTGNTGY